MKKAFKYRLYPNKEQSLKMEATLETCRNLYNDTLAERREAWEFDGFGLTYLDQQNDLPFKKKEDERLSEIYAQVLQDVVLRADKAFKGFFRRKAGYPRFKQYGRYDSFTYPQQGFCPMASGRVRLSGIGEVKAKLHRPIEGTIKTCTVRRQGGKWYVSFSCDNVPERRLKSNKKSVGIDVGLQYFAVLSTGETIANPRFFREMERKLRLQGRSLSRRTKGSSRRKKCVAKIQATHLKIRNKRDDFLNKTVRSVVNRFGTIAVEKLQIANMIRNRRLSKSIADASWGIFLSKMRVKAEEAGRNFVEVNPSGTSQTCLCGASVRKSLSERWHDCPKCGLSEQRDIVSAKLILGLGLSLQALNGASSPVVA